jgi:tetratricopeptide (TPR) repeat protein
MLSGHRIDETGGYVPADTRAAWDALAVTRAGPDRVPAITAWHERTAEASERRRQWFAAAWHLGRLTAAAPDRVDLWARRGRAHLELRQWEKAAADYTRAVERRADDPDLWRRRGDARAQLGQWDNAAADYQEAATLCETGTAPPSQKVELWARYARLRLMAGDREAYRKACRRLLDSIDATDASAVRAAVWTCVLEPDTGKEPSRLVEMLHRAKGPANHERLLALGAALYRAGKFEEAVRQLEEAGRIHGSATVFDRLFVVLALHRSGRGEPARQLLAKLRDWFDRNLPSDPTRVGDHGWETWVELQLLRREAEELVGGPGGNPDP